MEYTKPAPSKEARKQRLAQRAVRFTTKARKGTRRSRKQRAIKEQRDG